MKVRKQTLSADERTTLGLDRPVARESVFPLLAVFRQKTGRIPLLIFDQFDDYQAIHRERFLKGKRRAWISSAGLVRVNAFWHQIKKQLDDRHIHLLFVTREDAAAGLLSVQFCDPESQPLDRLSAQYLLPVLDELTRAVGADGPLIVANPDAGWQQLKRRLERDLTRDDVVLPMQIQAAIQGLASLQNHFLTVGNYNRAGGLLGLEAAFVERCITSAKRLHHIEPATSRVVLRKLVDGDKTVPAAVSELANRSGLPASSLGRILRHWEQLGLVRRRVPTGAPLLGGISKGRFLGALPRLSLSRYCRG
jgi:hypothetical protein